MRRFVASGFLGLAFLAGALSPRAQPLPQQAQAQAQARAATAFVGTWRSGNFAYTFNGDGSYVYVGAMGNSAMTTKIAEEGTSSVAADVLTVARKRGLITNSNGYRQALAPEVTTFRFRSGNTPTGPAIQLFFPNGQAQVFYRQ